MDNSFPTLLSSVDVVEQVLNDFLDAWKSGHPIPLTKFFERIQNESPEVRESVQLLLVLQDQTLRWQMWSRQRELMSGTGDGAATQTEPDGRAPLLEDYVRHCSLDGGLESLPPEMVAHEFRMRIECGDRPAPEDYLQRFPHLTSTLSTMLTSSPPRMDSQLTATKDDALTVIDPALTHDEPIGRSQKTTLPMLPGEVPRRRRNDTERNANFGQYELLNEIARGAMGVVYRARHVTIDKIVALKMILAGQFASERQVDQFLLEAQNAGRLEHDNIVRIYDAGRINEQYYIAMAYIEGHSLADAVKSKSLTAQRAAEVVEDVARALHFAHIQPQPVYHRDIKPANVLLDNAGRPYVTDFGIAKRVEREGSTASNDDDIAGTPSYMPPEQTYGRDIGPWSDVYSTGALLYHLLTGRPPFLADSLLETIREVREMEPLPPRELNPKVDPDLEAVCLKCLEKDRTKRYSSAEHLADDLRRFLNHEPTQARPVSGLGRFAKWCYRNPTVAGLTLTTALLLIAVAVGTTLALFREKESKEREILARRDAEAAKAKAIKSEKEAIDARDAVSLERDAKIQALDREVLAKEDEKKAKIAATNAKDLAIMESEKARAAEVQAKKAKDAALTAQMEEAFQRKLAETAKSEADEARVDAESNLQRAISTVDVILTQSADSGLKDIPGMEDFRKRIAQSALEQLKPIIEAHPDAKKAFEAWARLLVVQAKLLNLTGESEKAVPVLRSAVKEYLEMTSDPNTDKQHLLLDLLASYRQLGENLVEQAKLDHTSSERPLDEKSRKLLEEAEKEFKKALAIQRGQPATVDVDCRWETELAKIHESHFIALTYLKRADEGLVPFERAISSLRDGLGKLPAMAMRRDAERQLGSCYSTLAMAEALEQSQPSVTALEKRLNRLKDAEAIHKRLLLDAPKAAEPRFELAMTNYSIARVMTDLAVVLKDKSRFTLASDKVEGSLKDFSVLAGEFPRTPIYEYRRVVALQLKAAILAEQENYKEAAEIMKKAESGIRTYNENFIEASQQKLRLRICVSALELYIVQLSDTDTSDRKATTSWLKECFGSIRKSANPGTDQGVVLEATILESVANRLSAAVIAEQSNKLRDWMSEMESAVSDLRGYGKTIPDPNSFGGGLRLSICREALVKASALFKSGDLKTLPATAEWTAKVFQELTTSKNSKVADEAADLLKFVSTLPKSKQ